MEISSLCDLNKRKFSFDVFSASRRPEKSEIKKEVFKAFFDTFVGVILRW
jgi:hypothetical protein